MICKSIKKYSARLAFGILIGTQVSFAHDFSGTLALDNCSGSLVRFPESKGTDKAMALTNGHCLRTRPSAGTAVIDIPSQREFSVLNAQGARIGVVTAERLVYSTMTETDIALYRLTNTFDEIKDKFKIEPFTLVSKPAEKGANFIFISGWRQSIQECAAEFIVPTLKEAGYTFHNSLRYNSSCTSLPFSSGSPLISTETREVIGINNTSNRGFGTPCSEDNPCEYDEATNTATTQARSYGQQTYLIVDCVDGNQFNLEKPSCKLTKTKSTAPSHNLP